MCRRNGSRNIKASSTRAGTRFARRRLPARRRSASCRPTPCSRPSPRRSRTGLRSATTRRRLFARQMEVFAGFGEYADTEIGRLISAIDELGQLDNTLVFYIIGDNGASAEGGMNGLFNESTYFNRRARERRRHPEAHRRTRRAEHLSPLLRRLGGGGRHALHLDEADRVELRRHAQRSCRALAEGDRGEERGPLAMASRDRRRADDPRRRRPARAEERRRHAADPDPGRQHDVLLRRPESEGPASDAIFRDRRKSRHLSRRLARRHDPSRAMGIYAARQADRRRVGALRRALRLQPRA